MRNNKITRIYKITSPTSKVYIGQSRDIKNRISKYKNLSLKRQPKIKNSLLKYGWENHTFEIVHKLPKDISQEVLDNYEVLYWEFYKDLGFNMLNRKKPSKYGKHSEESKLKIKNNTSINHKRSIETINKIKEKRKLQKNTRKGVLHSLETKLLISKLAKGRKIKNTENYRKNKNIYTILNNETKEIFIGSKYDFCTENNLSFESVCRLLSGKYKKYLKWSLINKQLCQ